MACLGKHYVALVIFYDENKNILLGKRLSEVLNGKYDSPGGKINFDEKVIDGLQREIKEETDILISSENLHKDLSLVVSESKLFSDIIENLLSYIVTSEITDSQSMLLLLT